MNCGEHIQHQPEGCLHAPPLSLVREELPPGLRLCLHLGCLGSLYTQLFTWQQYPTGMRARRADFVPVTPVSAALVWLWLEQLRSLRCLSTDLLTGCGIWWGVGVFQELGTG